jgi:hypothetical protein
MYLIGSDSEEPRDKYAAFGACSSFKKTLDQVKIVILKFRYTDIDN